MLATFCDFAPHRLDTRFLQERKEARWGAGVGQLSCLCSCPVLPRTPGPRGVCFGADPRPACPSAPTVGRHRA